MEPEEASVANVASASQKALTEQYELRLFNMQGSLVRNLRTTDREISIDVSGLPGGNYFLHILRNGATEPEVHKVIIVH